MTGAGKLPVDPDLLARARQALLDALEASRDHRESVVVIGAQAIYLHTGAAATPVAEATKDSDLAVDVRRLADQPHSVIPEIGLPVRLRLAEAECPVSRHAAL